MDPNANLSEQRRLIWALFNAHDRGKLPDRHQVARLCELAQALDEWLSSGGFPPDSWARAGSRAERERAFGPFSCPLCGQRIADGKPCDCGARRAS